MTTGSIIEYIDGYDGDVRQRLLTVYELIRSAVPDEAVESISWRMPTFKLGTEPLFVFTRVASLTTLTVSLRVPTSSTMVRRATRSVAPTTMSFCS